MAKSFHEIIESGRLEVRHGHEDVELELPQVLKDLKGRMMDKDLLAEWAKEYEIELGVYHAAIQKIIIDVRAKARPSVNVKTGETKSILEDQEEAQNRVDEFVIRPTNPPGSSKPKSFAAGEEAALKMAIESLQAAGLDNKKINEILSIKFEKAKVQMVLDQINGEE